MPDTTTRPRHWSIRTTAATKASPNRAASWVIALASVARTLRASASTRALSTPTWPGAAAGAAVAVTLMRQSITERLVCARGQVRGGKLNPAPGAGRVRTDVATHDRARSRVPDDRAGRRWRRATFDLDLVRRRTGRSAACTMPQTLQLILVLLGAAVVVVVICRLVRLPPILGYLLVGMLVGPNALGWVPVAGQTRDLAEFGIVFLMFSIGLEFSLPQLRAMRRAVFGLGLAQVAITTMGSMLVLHVARLRVAGGIRSGRRARDELDGDRLEDAGRADRACDAARSRRHGDPAVPGPGRRRVPDRAAVARHGRRRAGDGAGLRRPEGAGGAGLDPLRGAAADARVVPPRRKAAQPRAVHAEPAADHARARGADPIRRAVPRARRFPGGHADCGDRIPLPGRRGHQAVPRRAAGTVLRHRRHGARSGRRRAEPVVGAAAPPRCP